MTCKLHVQFSMWPSANPQGRAMPSQTPTNCYTKENPNTIYPLGCRQYVLLWWLLLLFFKGDLFAFVLARKVVSVEDRQMALVIMTAKCNNFNIWSWGLKKDLQSGKQGLESVCGSLIRGPHVGRVCIYMAGSWMIRDQYLHRERLRAERAEKALWFHMGIEPRDSSYRVAMKKWAGI